MTRARTINAQPITALPVSDALFANGEYDFTNSTIGTQALRKLGALQYFSRSGVARYYSYSDNLWKEAADGVIRFSDSPYNGTTGLLIEGEGGENHIKYSSEQNAAWLTGGGGGGINKTNVTSIIQGKSAVKLEATLTGSFYYQAAGTFTADEMNVYMIVETVPGDASPAVDIGVYNTTSTAWVARARLTFATGAVSLISGTTTLRKAIQYSKAGPNGGVVWLLMMSCTGTNGNQRRFTMYPDPLNGSGAVILHHAQLQNNPHGCSPIVTAGATVTQNPDVLYCEVPPGLDFQNDAPFTFIVSQSVITPSRTPQGATYLSVPAIVAKSDLSSFVGCIVNYLGGSSIFYITNIAAESYLYYDTITTPTLGAVETVGCSKDAYDNIVSASRSAEGLGGQHNADVDSPILAIGYLGSGFLIHKLILRPYGVSADSLVNMCQ